jgi:hypothetical protein
VTARCASRCRLSSCLIPSLVPPKRQLPSIADLHKRHPRLTKATCTVFAECASVCLERHHPPSPTEFVVDREEGRDVYDLHWKATTPRTRGCHNNNDDATRDAAYGVSLATVEACHGLVAVDRADTRTGADWYLGQPQDELDLERQYRLEVSGTNLDIGEVRSRSKKKVHQLDVGRAKSREPGIAVVVGFKEGHVMVRLLKESGS